MLKKITLNQTDTDPIVLEECIDAMINELTLEHVRNGSPTSAAFESLCRETPDSYLSSSMDPADMKLFEALKAYESLCMEYDNEYDNDSTADSYLDLADTELLKAIKAWWKPE